MDLDDRLTQASDALERHVQPSVRLSDLDRRAKRAKSRRLGAAAIAAAVVTTIAAVSGGSADLDIAAGAPVTAAYERLEYVQEADLACEGGDLRAVDTFDRSTIEAWGDRVGRRWRNTVTYPDGTRRDVIAVDSPWYPSELYTRGAPEGAVLGCEDGTVGVLVAEPGQYAFYSLNPLADIPEVQAGAPAVPGYEHLGTKIPGAHTDSVGRPAELWRQVVSGYLGDGDAMRGPLTQTTEWFVDAATGDVLEMTYQNAVDGVGTARSRTTRLESSTTDVSPTLFDPSGYTRAASEPPPGSTDTTAVAGESGGTTPTTIADPMVGQPAPLVRGTSLVDGAIYDLRGDSATTVLVVFTATWCKPCLDQLDHLDNLSTAHDDLRIVLVGFSDSSDDLEAEVSSRGWTDPAIADVDGSIAEAFEVNAVPESFLIVNDTISAQFVGLLTPEELDEYLR